MTARVHSPTGAFFRMRSTHSRRNRVSGLALCAGHTPAFPCAGESRVRKVLPARPRPAPSTPKTSTGRSTHETAPLNRKGAVLKPAAQTAASSPNRQPLEDRRIGLDPAVLSGGFLSPAADPVGQRDQRKATEDRSDAPVSRTFASDHRSRLGTVPGATAVSAPARAMRRAFTRMVVSARPSASASQHVNPPE